MDQTMRTYEGMFLVDAGQPSLEAACEPIKKVLQRAEAEVLSLKPWDERRLAYEIKGRRRGLYILTYFRAEASKLAELEHECRLNEQILRALFLRRDHLSPEQINAETPATLAAKKIAEAAERKQAEQQAEPDTAESPEQQQPQDAEPAAEKTEPQEPQDQQQQQQDETASPEQADQKEA